MSVPFKYHEVSEYSIVEYESLPSTNQKLYQQALKGCLDRTVVWTKKQTAGKGYYGNKWESQFNKNLSFSILYKQPLNLNDTHYLSMVIAISLCEFLSEFGIKSNAKWPNDIIADNKKISGVLIENKIQSKVSLFSVIGIGININQLKFEQTESATSLRLLTQKEYKLESLLEDYLLKLSFYLDLLTNKNYKEIERLYIARLYKYKVEAKYIIGNQYHTGVFQGIDSKGDAIILLEDDKLHVFKHKEISLVYP